MELEKKSFFRNFISETPNFLCMWLFRKCSDHSFKSRDIKIFLLIPGSELQNLVKKFKAALKV